MKTYSADRTFSVHFQRSIIPEVSREPKLRGKIRRRTFIERAAVLALCSMNVYEQVKMIVVALEAKGNRFEAAEVTWLAKLEDSFGHTLPTIFRELVAHFSFPEFVVSGVRVFSNLNDGSHSDITVAPFADRFIFSWLKSHRFVQFGRRDTGSYDPVCFDLSERERDPVVVVLNHEDILLQRKFVHLEQIALSFIDLVNAELHNKRLQPLARKTRSG